MALFRKPFFESKNKDVEGAYSTGIFCLQKNDLYGANDYFKQAAEEGHISALYNLSLLNGGGSISPYNIDFAIDCFRKAATGGHSTAKEYSIWIDKAEDTSFGTIALSMYAKSIPAQSEPNHLLMMIACRLYSALCERYEAIDAVIKYELASASRSDCEFVHKFIERTGISQFDYNRDTLFLEEGSAADQIVDGLSGLNDSLREAGNSDEIRIMIGCTILGYIISKSKFSNSAKPLLGIDRFFD